MSDEATGSGPRTTIEVGVIARPQGPKPPLSDHERRQKNEGRRTRRRRLVRFVLLGLILGGAVVGGLGAVREFERKQAAEQARVRAASEAFSEMTPAEAEAFKKFVGPTSTSSGNRTPTSVAATVRAEGCGSTCRIYRRNSPNDDLSVRGGSYRIHGDKVMVVCGTNGQVVRDGDTGRESSTWYKLDGSWWISAVYLDVSDASRVAPC